VLDYNIRNGIKLFRISSDVIPFASKQEVIFPWQELFRDRLHEIGGMALENNIRLSMHPGQYTVLNSLDAGVVERAVLDLAYHSELLDLCGLKKDSKIILHIGGVYGNKEEAKNRFIENYLNLPEFIKNRLVIENDDKLYNIEDIIEISQKTDIPVVFDVLHHKVNPPAVDKKLYEWVQICGQTWKQEDGNQKIHYSQQQVGNKPGSHSKSISIDDFLEFYQEIEPLDPDIMLEVKDKNLSAVKCLLSTKKEGEIRLLEKEWGRYKYNILEHSPAYYQAIRTLLKDKKDYPAVLFYRYLEEAMATEPALGHVVNALQHVWGYYKNDVTDIEKSKFLTLLKEYEEEQIDLKKIKSFLRKVAERYPNPYIQQSFYFENLY